MYERFTDRARRVIQLANHEAQQFNHEYIGTEHILLGLIVEGAGVGANVLKNLGINLDQVREFFKIIRPAPDLVTRGKLPMTLRTKTIIEFAMEEARNLNHNYIGTEHLLLGTLRETEGVGAQVLMNLGLQLKEVRDEILTFLGRTGDEFAPETRMAQTDSSILKPLKKPAEYTDRARKVMLLAAEEAYNLRHTYIGPEHILLGIYREGTGIGVELLKTAGLTEANLRGELEGIVDASRHVRRGHFQHTFLLRKVLSLAADSALSLSAEKIDSDHIVLALLEQQSGIVDLVFISFMINRSELAKQICARLESGDQSQAGEE